MPDTARAEDDGLPVGPDEQGSDLPEDQTGHVVGPGQTRAATAGGVAGAAVGGVVGGPPGMVVGAVTGVARGLLLQRVAEKVDQMAEAKGREIADTLLGPPDDEQAPASSEDVSAAGPDAA